MADKQLVLTPDDQEITRHRTGIVPARSYVTTLRHMSYGRLPLHWHEEMQWVVILEGAAVFHVPKDRMFLQQGEVLFINSGRLHAAEDAGSDPCTYLCINVHPSFLLPASLQDTYVAPFMTDPRFAYREWKGDVAGNNEMIASLRAVQQALEEQSPAFELTVSRYMSHVWTQMIQDEKPGTEKHWENNEERTIKAMIAWVQDHYAETIRLEDVANAGLLSRSECCRYFRRVLRTTPLTYVKEYRLQQSVELLQQSEASITDIAFHTGFSSASHFIGSFRTYINMTPLAYRKHLRGESSHR